MQVLPGDAHSLPGNHSICKTLLPKTQGNTGVLLSMGRGLALLAMAGRAPGCRHCQGSHRDHIQGSIWK